MTENNTLNQLRPMQLPNREIKVGARVLRRLPEGVEEKPYTLFEVKPLGPIIGAEIYGVDLSQPVYEELKAEIYRALLEWKVLFFRNQNITSEQQLEFAKLWGTLEKHPFFPQGDSDQVARLKKDDKSVGYENIWHSDVSWKLEPTMGSVLRMVQKPPYGGDTLWACMGAAYDNLPDDIKTKIDGLTAIHDFTPTFGSNLPPELLAAKQLEYPAAEHPVVRTHPDSGRKLLFVNEPFTTRIVGMEDEESEKLLQYLFKQVDVPEYQVRFRWEENSIAFWDNRAVQHYAVNDYYPNPRTVERVSINGDRPF